MLRIIEGLAEDWRRLDERIERLSGETETIAHQDKACERLMTVPGIGPIISSAMVAAIGTGEVFSKGRDFGAWRLVWNGLGNQLDRSAHLPLGGDHRLSLLELARSDFIRPV